MPARVLFLGRTIAHFSYYESVIAALLERGAAVEYATDRQWSAKWSGGDASVQEFRARYPQLAVGWSVRRSDAHRDRLFALRELRSFRSYLVREDTTPYYVDRWKGYLSPEERELYGREDARRRLMSPLTDLALRWEEHRTPPDPLIIGDLINKAPDVMVISPANMRFAEETDYLKAARRLGIPTAVPVLSWDNLSTKGLLQIEPDRLFVWNEFQHEDALKIHKLPARKVSIAGSPFLDKWFAPPTDPLTREELCARLGFDPKRKILLYLGSSKNIATDESWFVEEVAQALKARGDKQVRGMQILIRPHPANADIYRWLTQAGMKVWPEDGALPETRQGFADMRNSFEHADAALGINTSGMIDAVLAGLPTFTVRLPKYAQTQADSRHFRYLQDGGALYLCDDLAAFTGALAGVLKGDDPKAANRRDFTRRFARPRGLERSAGDVIAEEVLALAKGRAEGRRTGAAA
jgi:hypothetical protein